MSDNPFAEPGDQDRTVIRPMPGGTRAGLRPAPAVPTHAAPAQPVPAQTVYARAAPVAPAPPPEPAPPTAGPDIEAVSAGSGPLAVAAAPLLHLLARLRNTATAPDPGDVRERTRRELRAFERRARDAGVAPDQLRLAHYALCASLDDAVLNTPWGNRGRWRDEPLARALHHDADAGRGFFDQLRTLRDGLPGTLPVIELMFVCLSLGMMGPYRTAPDGPAQIERVRHRVFELIAGAAPTNPATLAPDASGIEVPAAPRRGGVPVWVAASVALAILAGLYAWWLSDLNAASDEVYRAALAAPPAAMPELVRPPATPPPPPPPPPEPRTDPAEPLRAALAGLSDVAVIPTPDAIVLRIPAQALFPRPNATLAPGPLLDRVAQAVKAAPAADAGPIRVIGYTDNVPSRSVGFPSNFALSTARAKAVQAVLARTVPSPGRIAAEGRAEGDPIAPNTTAEGRERNRRIDILLPRAP